MKKSTMKVLLSTVLVVACVITQGQEYDDLYYTKQDRIAEQSGGRVVNDRYQNRNYNYQQPIENPETNQEELSFLGRQYQWSEPAGDVSQEALDYYKPEKTQEYYTDQQENNYVNTNPNYGNPPVASEQPMTQESFQEPVVINNYYNGMPTNGGAWNQWNRPRWRMGMGMGWNNWGGNFWSVSFGNAWGNPWHDPFWDPWYFNGPRVGWGWNTWGWRGGFNDPFWHPAWGGRTVVVYPYANEFQSRNVVRARRSSRGGDMSRSSRSGSGRVIRTAGSDRVEEGRASYSRQQADYLNRSRSSQNTRTSAPNVNRRSRESSAVNTRSSSSRSGNTRNENVSRQSRSSGSSSNYGNRTNSSGRSYTPSRSSSGSSRSGSVRSSGRSSRSSSGSVGRSSRGSSSRSSGSRSSSGSSRSGSRRGN